MDQPETDATPGEEARKTDVHELVENYLTARRDEHGSGTYAASAKSELDRWVNWMAERDYGLDTLDERGPEILRQYATRLRQRTQSGGIAASTAQTYFAYVSACLSFAVREGRLKRNPAQTETARELLPEDSRDRGDQQHWSPEQRAQLMNHVVDRAEAVIDEDPFDAYTEARDRALVAMLYYAAVRGAEVLRHRQDERDGRQGLRWGRVDLEVGTMRILGKDQSWETAPIPSPALSPLQVLKKIQRPASDDWPVFATSHAPSLWKAAREQLDGDIDTLVEDLGSIDAVLREHDVAPPALTTDGARSVLKRLTEAAEVDVDEGYLQPHGARRGMIGEVYKRDRGEAQDLGRHKSMETTREAYSHLDAEEQRKRLDDLVEEF
ncbi:tyrosine-type recombinase/integrase [Salinirubellus sp. GCM10025818]|uniref:tyrosine-type recombinase/integrase n=2 Tax=Salinirubellus TaxID=2162630 RepID=UPI00360811AD